MGPTAPLGGAWTVSARRPAAQTRPTCARPPSAPRPSTAPSTPRRPSGRRPSPCAATPVGDRRASSPTPPTPAPPRAVAPLAIVRAESDEAVVLRGKRWWDWNSWTPRGQGLVLLNLLVVLCASNWVIVKDAEASYDPAAFTALRFVVAAAFFVPFLGRANREAWVAGAELGVWFAAGYLAQAEGLLTIDASRASFLSTFSVLAVPLLNGLVGVPVSLTTWACAGSALVGVFFLENGGAPPGPGDAWSILSALFFAVQIWRTEARAREEGQGDILGLLAVIVTIVAVVSLGAAALQNPEGAHRLLTSLSADRDVLADVPWPAVLYTGLLSTDAVLLIEVVALRAVSSTDAAIVYTTEPVLGALLAAAFLGERPTLSAYVGAAIILVSAFTAQVAGAVGNGKQE